MINNKEIQLAAKWLKAAAEHYGNHVCNDVPETFWHGWTLEQRQKFVKDFYEYNGNPHEYNQNNLNLPDYAILDFLSYKLSGGNV